jgi:hypothetical protein
MAGLGYAARRRRGGPDGPLHRPLVLARVSLRLLADHHDVPAGRSVAPGSPGYSGTRSLVGPCSSAPLDHKSTTISVCGSPLKTCPAPTATSGRFGHRRGPAAVEAMTVAPHRLPAAREKSWAILPVAQLRRPQ